MGLFRKDPASNNTIRYPDPLDEPGRVVPFRRIRLWLKARRAVEPAAPPPYFPGEKVSPSETFTHDKTPAGKTNPLPSQKSSGTSVKTFPDTPSGQKTEQTGQEGRLTQLAYALFSRIAKWVKSRKSRHLLDRITVILKYPLKELEKAQAPTEEELKEAEIYQKKSASEKKEIENSQKKFFLSVSRGVIWICLFIGITILHQCS